MRKLIAGLVLAGVVAAPAAASNDTITFAVIGDTPYDAAQEAALPGLVTSVNADRKVRFVAHLGDIKGGSTPCSDAYFTRVRTLFDTFADAVVYTPGDNEWTDCHRAAAGGHVPTERLAKVRETFFPHAGRTIGGRAMRVTTQASEPRHSAFVENVRFFRSGVAFATLHVVGSNNDRQPWFGAAETSAQRAARVAEFTARDAAALDWIDETFATARSRKAEAVVLMMQADMWDAFSVANGIPLDGFNMIVDRIARRAAAFRKPVLLLQGDSHDFVDDRPLQTGSPVHGVTTAAPNLHRVIVYGGPRTTLARRVEWLRVTVDADAAQPFTLERRPQ